jgi:phosphodiesterase/alkaline phosphatase D-like protein
MQGTTSASVTHFTVTAHRDEKLVFEAWEGDLVHEPSGVERREFEGSDWVVYRLKFDDMTLGSNYRLKVFKDGELKDERGFKMLDPLMPEGRIAITSCMLRQFHNPFLWNQLARPENKPDLLLIIGDVVYLDRANLFIKQNPKTELEVWNSFAASRNELNLYRWKDLVPIVSVWDDHDSGGDNVDSKFELMAKIFPIYETYMANDEIKGFIEHGPGLAKKFQLFGKNFLMLDGRTYREADPRSPLFGAQQERWLVDNVRPGANFLVNGIQFFGKYLPKDSMEHNWPEYAVEFGKMLNQVGQEKNAQFAFVSGDIHFSQVQLIEPTILGYETVEVTSSSAHSMTFPGRHIFHPANPREFAVTSTHNAVLMDFPKSDLPFQFNLRSVGWRGNTLFQQPINIDTVNCSARVID